MDRLTPRTSFHRPKPASALIILLLSLALAACGSLQRSRTTAPAARATVTASPWASATRTASPTPLTLQYGTPRPSATPSQTPTKTITPTATITPTYPAFALPTTDAGPEAYRLKPWNQSEALGMLEEAGTVQLPEKYENMRGFYMVSLVEEAWLRFPNLRSDPALVRQMAELKGIGWYVPKKYGLLHDRAAEPFRQMMENALNDGSAKIDLLIPWIQNQGAYVQGSTVGTEGLFDSPSSARVVKVEGDGVWDFFIIRTLAPGRYSVVALYPEWEKAWWSDESFQIADLNADGRDEIGVTYDGWGTGFSHFCERSFKLYEWDGKAFQNIIAEPLKVLANTDSYDCMEITFPPDPRGGKKIQTGIEELTCPELPYQDIITFRWDGKAYREEPAPAPRPTKQLPPSSCTLRWALSAGPDNDAALNFLTAAVANWPAEANAEWGPGGRDYFRLKLAAWNLRRGQAERGLALMRELRDHPSDPAYPLLSRVAAAFLDAYPRKGWVEATLEAGGLYAKEIEPYCSIDGCNYERLIHDLGFALSAEDFAYSRSFSNDFQVSDGLTLALQQNPPPTRLDGLTAWLERNQLHPVWAIEGDLDGQGEADVLTEIQTSVEIAGETKTSHWTYALFRQKGQISAIRLEGIYLSSSDNSNNLRWRIFRPDPKGLPEIVFQGGVGLYAFHLPLIQGKRAVEVDLDTLDTWLGDADVRSKVKDWKIENDRLVIQYDGGGEGVYTWDAAQGKLVPGGFGPEMQEEHVRQIEQALYVDNDPARAVTLLEEQFRERIWETYAWEWGVDITNPPRVRPYLQYLLGLAYERSGEAEKAAQAYWQLWHDYPDFPYSLAVMSKLEIK